MTTLYSCEPHFVRCLVPKTHKKPGEVEPHLIMHRLTCNGVLEGIRICMRGFPNRMLYPDFKMRYACLGQKEIASSSDNKTATYALMDKINFDRQRYRLGHTLVFFRAGALAGLEEARDDLVIKWVRLIQGEVFKRIRGEVYAKKRDQRELIKVAQRNFRKYMALREWGWFVIIQRTRPLIGRPNPEKEQGNLSIYHEKQAAATAAIGDLEKKLVESQDRLAQREADRQQATQDKKVLEQETVAVKKDIEDINVAIQKLEQEKTNRDHTIKSLNDEIANQDEVINKLNKEKKHISENA